MYESFARVAKIVAPLDNHVVDTEALLQVLVQEDAHLLAPACIDRLKETNETL